MIDAPWYVDAAAMAVLVLAAAFEAWNLACLGHSAARWLRFIGWTGLSVRFGLGLMLYGNVAVHAASLPFLVAIASGTVLSALKQLRAERVRIYCLREPTLRCNREDRIREEMRRRMEP